MLLAGLLISVVTGGAVATAGLMQLNDITNEFKSLSHEAPLSRGTVEEAAPGKPQTILLVGSDHRYADGKSDAPASQGDPTKQSTAIVTGQRSEPEPAVRRAPPESTQPETPEQQAVRRAQTPLPGSEKYEGENPDGFGANVGKPAPNATPVPERVEGAADAKTDTGVAKSVYYTKVDAKRPQSRPTLAPDVVKARPTPLANREFGTENIGAIAYNAKWSAYGEYMQKFIESVDIQWQRIVEQSNVYPVAGTKVVVKFRINSKGEIAEIEPNSTGGRAAISACVSAIVFRKSYGAWSDDMIGVLGESQEITFTFFYN